MSVHKLTLAISPPAASNFSQHLYSVSIEVMLQQRGAPAKISAFLHNREGLLTSQCALELNGERRESTTEFYAERRLSLVVLSICTLLQRENGNLRLIPSNKRFLASIDSLSMLLCLPFTFLRLQFSYLTIFIELLVGKQFDDVCRHVQTRVKSVNRSMRKALAL